MKQMVISFYDGGIRYDLVIERDHASLDTAMDFLETFHPNAHLINFKEKQ